MQNNLTIMIKPASSLCNMRCRYCFYLDEVGTRIKDSPCLMSKEITKNIITQALKYTRDNLSIVFQGGEPLLAGLSYFEMVSKIVEENNINNTNVYYCLQTNGTLIDEEYAKFFKEQNYLIGVSLDGTRDTHNINRLYQNEHDTYGDVIKGIDLLEKYNVDYNILTVITDDVADNIDCIYHDYMSKGFRYLQFIPYIDSVNSGKEFLSSEKLGKGLIKLFEYWYQDILNDNRWYNRYFDNLLNMYALGYTSECTLSGRCARSICFEANGDAYPCDFYMTDKHLLGNINDSTILGLLDKTTSFISYSSIGTDKCKNCKFLKLCNGGCRIEREGLEINRYCEGYKMFFEYAKPRLDNIINLIRQGKV